MSDLKPIKVWAMPQGPNPWKVVLILEELGVPYEVNSIPYSEVKNEPFISVNPNGRVPAIEDYNTGITLWESGAIILYLIEQYDKENKLSYGSEKFMEKNLERQWLMFQVSGQGPYFGQAGVFNHLFPEKIPSVIARYVDEVRRVLTVLDGALAKSTYLVGDKLTYADLSFLPYNARIGDLAQKSADELFEGLENVKRWHESMLALPSWRRTMELRAQKLSDQGFNPDGLTRKD